MILEVGEMKMASDGLWPPGFRFHPTDEELILYYLKKKICKKRIKVDIIAETDVYKWDPEELPGRSLLKTGDRQWFFFSPRDRKYPNGARSNRATRLGYWKATGKDRIISCNSRNVGLKKTLVFYRGRAPNGERTDWVMHEYTLDEEELKRCENVQDYYALYKVFKKSGPGPKNGEQYGAPFKEEEWNDDDCLDVTRSVNPEIPAKQLKEVDPVNCVTANDQVSWTLDDHEFEELIKQFADDPVHPDLHISHANEAPQVFGEEEAQSTLLNPSSREIFVPMPNRCDEEGSFDFTQSASSNLQPFEASEVTSAPKNSEQVLQLCEEDFLEMDDLIGPEPIISNVEEPAANLQFDEFDGLNELELFHEANMFLHDIVPLDQEAIVNVLGSNAVNQVDHQIEPYSAANQVDHQIQLHSAANQVDHQLPQDLAVSRVDYHFRSQSLENPVVHQLQPNLAMNQVDYEFHSQSAVNLVQHQLQPNLAVNQVDYQLQSHLLGPDQFNSQLWMHHEQSNVLTPEELNQANLCPPTSGMVHESTHPLTEANQNQGTQEGGGAASWFSSSLWSFVESIPTTPASASESPLVSRALERMSSFSRMRLNARNINVAGNATAVTRRQAGSSNRVFLILSILGVLCGILWMLLGNVRVLWRCISS